MLLKLRTGGFVLACLISTACSGGGSSGGDTTPKPTATPTASPTPASTAPATISVSSSTNTAAYTIVLQTSGSAVATQNGVSTSGTVTSSVTAQFFADLAQNSPIDNVQTNNGCTKSASYGTTTQLTYMGYTTGDISCPPTATSPAQTLYTDAENVEKQLGFNGN